MDDNGSLPLTIEAESESVELSSDASPAAAASLERDRVSIGDVCAKSTSTTDCSGYCSYYYGSTGGSPD